MRQDFGGPRGPVVKRRLMEAALLRPVLFLFHLQPGERAALDEGEAGSFATGGCRGDISLLDHLIRSLQERLRDRQPERLRGLVVDD